MPRMNIASEPDNDNCQRHYFDHANCRLSFLDFGNAEKPDLILLHGMQDHAMSMVEIAQALRENYHVVALDMRGHGKSDNPGIYAMVHFVADLRALSRHCKLKKPVLVAHSLGGHIASRYAAFYSEDVSKLVLLDGMGPPSVEKKQDKELSKSRMRIAIQMLSRQNSEGRKMADEPEAINRLMKNNPKLSHGLATTIVHHGTRAHSQGGVTWSFDAAVQMIWSTFSFDESENIWSWIECPTLIVTGTHALDHWVNMREDLRGKQAFYEAILQRREKLFADARHKVIEDAGHMLHYDQPSALNKVLKDFLVTT